MTLSVAAVSGGLQTTSTAGSLGVFTVSPGGAIELLNSWWSSGGGNVWAGWSKAADGHYYVKNFSTQERLDFWRNDGQLQLTAPVVTGVTATPLDPWGGLCKPAGFRLPQSFWNADVTRAPVDPDSDDIIDYLVAHPGGYGATWAFNCHGSGTSIAAPPPASPRADWAFYDATKRPGGLPASFAAVLRQLPSPAWLRPAGYSNPHSTDHQLSIIDGDILTELWLAGNGQAGIPGWSACWGGSTLISTGTGQFGNGLGASASRLTITAGAMGIRETLAAAAAGTGLDHALNMCSAAVATVFRWPALFADGHDSSCLVQEGMWLRMKATVNPGMPGLSKIGRVVVRTAQSHGIVVTDQGGQCGISAEDPGMVVAAGFPDPWATLTNVAKDYLVLQNIPWDQLEVLHPAWRP